MYLEIGILIVLVIAYVYYTKKPVAPAKTTYKEVPYVDPSLNQPTSSSTPLLNPITDTELKELGGIGGTVTTTGRGLKGSVPITFKYEGIEPTCEEYKKALIANELNPDPGSEWALKCPEVGQVTRLGMYQFGDTINKSSCAYMGTMTCAKLNECAKAYGVTSFQTVLCEQTPTKILAYA